MSSEADYTCYGTESKLRTVLQTANVAAHRRLRQVLASFAPDVVHVRIFLTQLSPLILPLLRSMPAVAHVVWYRPVCPTGTKLLPDGAACRVRAGLVCRRTGCVPTRDLPAHLLQRVLIRRWFGVFDAVLALSDDVRAELLSDGLTDARVMGNAVAEREQRPALVDPPTVAFAGRLVREKGVETLVNAFATAVRSVPTARLLIAGAGPKRVELERLAVSLGIADRVTFLGHVDPEQLERELGAVWVQAVPSLWREPWGNAAGEALMRGTAVVASCTGGLADLVDHERTGLHVPPGDAAALAAALVRLLGDRNLAETMGRAAREHALRELAPQRYVDRLLDVYASVAGRYDRPAAEAR